MADVNNRPKCKTCDRPAAKSYLQCWKCAEKRRQENAQPCAVEDCQNKASKRGMCNKHYLRKKKTGTTDSLSTPKGEPLRWLRELCENPPADKCVLWPFSKLNVGYGVVRFEGKNIAANRAALIITTGENPKGMDAAHGPCNNRLCCNPHPDHGLRWASRKQNVQDMVDYGDIDGRRASELRRAGLTEEKILKIYQDSGTVAAIAKRHSVSLYQAGAIRRGDSWAWITNADAV